jgi:hypothetical protein
MHTLLLALALHVLAGESHTLTQLQGIRVLADSQHRDRWGADGFHPSWVLDDPSSVSDFAPGGEYEVIDIGPGDPVQVVPQGSVE